MHPHSETTPSLLREPFNGVAQLVGFIEHTGELQAEDRGFADVLTASFPAPGEPHTVRQLDQAVDAAGLRA
jgi:hypothetical protein